MSEERFLSRKNVVQAIWALVLALVAFVCGAIYNRFTGPPRIVVTTAPDDPVAKNAGRQTETLVALAENVQTMHRELAARDAAASHREEETARTLKELSETLLKQAENAPDAASKAALQRMEREIQDLRSKQFSDQLERDLAALDQKYAEQRKIIDKWIVEQKRPATARDAWEAIQEGGDHPAFRLPATAKGYQPTPLVDVRTAKCPDAQLKPDATLHLSFYVSDPALPKKATPVVVKAILLGESDKPVLQILERTYPMKAGTNEVVEAIRLEPGSYHLSYGYFLWSELDMEYPRYYSRDCRFVVRGE